MYSRPVDWGSHFRAHIAFACNFLILRGAAVLWCSPGVTVRRRGRGSLGGAGGRIKGGRNLDYLKNPNRQMSRLFLSMMDKMNVRPKTFGDAVAPLDEV